MNEKIALDFAFCIHEGRITTLTRFEAQNVVRHLPMNEFLAICAKDTKPAPRAQIDQSGRLRQSEILGFGRIVNGNKFFAVYLGKRCVASRVEIMQRKRS